MDKAVLEKVVQRRLRWFEHVERIAIDRRQWLEYGHPYVESSC